ncbi:MAG TPA: alpha/beta fold hydrolase [Herpetosiphonaceae bacterium]|nr:alpha/beta fold hydrolase [Herpetosiphonaceae bacterium]
MAANPTNRWPRRRRRLGALALASFLAANAIACMQARALLRYGPPGENTPGIEALTFGQKLRTILLGAQVPRPENRRTPADLGWDYEVAAIDTAAGPLEAWVLPGRPDGGVALLFHGYAASKESLLPAAAPFRARGYTAVLVDFHGSGGSAGASTSLGASEAGDVAAALDYARRIWPGRPLAVYGFSMGSAAAVRALAADPLAPDALILEAPFDRLLTTVGHRFTAMGLPAAPGAELLVFWGSLQAGFNGFAFNPVEDARRISSPTLLVHGADDPRVTADEVRSFAGALRGPSSFVDVAGVGHEPVSVADPAAWERIAGEFLDSLEPGR